MMAEPLTLPALLRRNREVFGDKAVMTTLGQSITHAELDEASARLAGHLVASGVDKSARVGLMMENGIEWAVIGAAIMRVGAVLVPLSTLLKPPELQAQLQTAHVTELIVTTEFRGRNYLSDLEQIAPGLTTGGTGRRQVELPDLRRLWTADDLPSSRAADGLVREASKAWR